MVAEVILEFQQTKGPNSKRIKITMCHWVSRFAIT